MILRLLEVVDSAFIAYAVYFYLITYAVPPSPYVDHLSTVLPISNWGNALILIMRVQWYVHFFCQNFGPALTYRHRSLIVSLDHAMQKHPLTIETLASSHTRRE